MQRRRQQVTVSIRGQVQISISPAGATGHGYQDCKNACMPCPAGEIAVQCMHTAHLRWSVSSPAAATAKIMHCHGSSVSQPRICRAGPAREGKGRGQHRAGVRTQNRAGHCDASNTSTPCIPQQELPAMLCAWGGPAERRLTRSGLPSWPPVPPAGASGAAAGRGCRRLQRGEGRKGQGSRHAQRTTKAAACLSVQLAGSGQIQSARKHPRTHTLLCSNPHL
jgi:hypothetical protein